MSIEAMKQLIELYDKHCYNNDYGGIEFNKKHGYKFIEAIEALRTAIQQAESEPVWFHKHWCDGDDIFYRPDDNIPPESVPLYTHPAPGVPEDVARDAKRWRTFLATRPSNTHEGIIAAIDAAMLAAQDRA